MKKEILFIFVLLAMGCSNSTKQEQQSNDSLIGSEEFNIFNATGYPVVKEPITITGMVFKRTLHGDFNQMPILQKMQKITGVNVKYQGIPDTNYDEKVNLLFASDNLPDFLFARVPTNIQKFSNIIRPLDGYIEKYMPNLQAVYQNRPNYRKISINPDGNIYSLRAIQEFPLRETPVDLTINKQWLEKLNLGIPETTDDFYRVLKAFKEQDPNENGEPDEIPFSTRSRNLWSWDGLYIFLGSFTFPFDDTFLHVKNDKTIVFTPMDGKEGFINFILWWQKLYQEGLIDYEIYTQDESQFFAKGKEEPPVLGSFASWFVEEVVGNESDEKYAFVKALKGPSGKQLWRRDTQAFSRERVGALSKKNKYPASTMRYVDLGYDPEYSMQIVHGPFDIVLEKLNNGDIAALPAPERMTPDEWRFQNSPAHTYPYAVLNDMYALFIPPKPHQRKTRHHDVLEPFLPPVAEYVPDLSFTEEEDSELSILKTDITNYFNKAYIGWIVNNNDPNKQWNEFVDQLMAIGLDRYLKIYQEAFDRYNR